MAKYITREERLTNACFSGDLEKVKYLINSKRFKNNINFMKYEDLNYDSHYIDFACIGGQLEVVKYLLNYQYLEKNIDIQNELNRLLLKACYSANRIELIRFLLTSPELKTHAVIKDIPCVNILVKSYEYKSMDIVDYLIFDYGINISEKLKEYIYVFHSGLHEKLELKYLNDKLQELPKQETKKKPIKI